MFLLPAQCDDNQKQSKPTMATKPHFSLKARHPSDHNHTDTLSTLQIAIQQRKIWKKNMKHLDLKKYETMAYQQILHKLNPTILKCHHPTSWSSSSDPAVSSVTLITLTMKTTPSLFARRFISLLTFNFGCRFRYGFMWCAVCHVVGGLVPCGYSLSSQSY